MRPSPAMEYMHSGCPGDVGEPYAWAQVKGSQIKESCTTVDRPRKSTASATKKELLISEVLEETKQN